MEQKQKVMSAGTYEIVVHQVRDDHYKYVLSVTDEDIAAFQSENPDDQPSVGMLLEWLMEQAPAPAEWLKSGDYCNDILSVESAGVVSVLNAPSIRVTFFGGTDQVSFAQFTAQYVQDHDEALRIAESLLASPDLEVDVNNDDPTVFQRYEVTDLNLLRVQVGAAETS